ncbi:hypothetical protein [Salinibacter ruber]|uniref:hypothetical protein n=1 Tax=Salinibacter ruber TaxID=146919 RepID=UPI0020734325|nr:hypothetical protein [Salinibacter ruber]
MEKNQKEEQLFAAWIDASMEMSRRILTLSSAGIALLATVGVNLDVASVLLKWLLGISATSFGIAVLGTLITLHLDPKLANEIRKNLGEEDSRWQRSLECWITKVGDFAKISFGVGLLSLLATLLRAIYLLPVP